MNKKSIYQQFCADLTEKYLKELKGEGENSEYIFESRPSEKVLIGVLDSGIKNDEFMRYTSMPMVKVHFFIDSSDIGKLKIDISGNLYYNVLPTYEEEKEYIDKLQDKQLNSEFEDNNDTRFKIVSLVSKYKKVSMAEVWKNIVISKKDLLENGEIDFSDELNKGLKNINFEDSVYFNKKQIIKEITETKEKFDEYIKTHMGGEWDDSPIIKARPGWKFSGVVTCKPYPKSEKFIVTLIIENITPKSQSYKAKKFEKEKYSIPLYNVGVQIEAIDGLTFEDIELDKFEKSYKVNSKVKAEGEWLSAECEGNKIIVQSIPKYIEKRLLTNDKYNKNANFIALQEYPVENLKEILQGMRDYYVEISSRKIENEEFFDDLQKFKYEITRFEKGINILEDPDFISIKKAFICMNKTFEKLFGQKADSWRLFQLVFIVSMIPDIVYNENKDILESELYNYNDYDTAEIIYFPTGGGKTEAFLGTVVLSCFYDRFIGKKYGVNTVIKYPLRLLSIQQLERTLDALVVANSVLKANDEIKNLPIFTLGYFVGSSNTPNEIKDEKIGKYEHKKEYILVNKCPKCEGKIDVIFNYDSRVLEHKCTQCENVLPLYIVDDEIYRFLPTVLISTIDKLAGISFNDGFRNILGGSKYRCPIHGFTHNNKCICNVNDKLEDVYEKQMPSLAPTLFIQDEIHLLKESLGVFSAHYESLLEYYTKELIFKEHRKKIKYIGATATISGAEYLVNELYGKGCRIFPSPSTYPSGENFYSKPSEDDITRIIIGFAPFGVSISSRIEYVVSTLRLILWEMYKNSQKYAPQYKLSEEEFKEMVFYYWTSIVYCRSKDDNNKLRNTFEQQANNARFDDIAEAHFNIVRMTGDENFSQIKDTLNSIALERNKIEANNLILATSTISHGVDSKDFNNIFFYGVPSNIAEYIQSYSRVGRTYTGMVIDIIRLARNRDISFLNYFNMMHKYKDYLIDKTRLNSKSSIAMYRTFPGIVISLLKHYYSVRDGKKYETLDEVESFFWYENIKNEENINDMFGRLCKIYRCENALDESSVDLQFKKNIYFELISMVKNLHSKIGESLDSNQSFRKHINKLTTNKFLPMLSLREVDENYDIGLSGGGDNNEKK